MLTTTRPQRAKTGNGDGRCRRARGFTLIEVLVALVVLAIGLLGVASLQITSKRGNLEAQQRAQAVFLAEDLLERMRANSDALGTYTNFDGDSDDTFTITLTDGAGDVAAFDCFDEGGSVTDCDDDEVAQWDLDTFEDAVLGTGEVLGGTNIGGLALPVACISGDSDGASGLYVVAIAWRGLDDLPTPTTSTCGQGNAAYQDGAIDDTDGGRSFRRVITVTAYITPDD